MTDKQEIILVAQAIAVALSGLILYLIGKQVLRNKFYALSILIAYFLFVGLQNAVMFLQIKVMMMEKLLILSLKLFQLKQVFQSRKQTEKKTIPGREQQKTFN